MNSQVLFECYPETAPKHQNLQDMLAISLKIGKEAIYIAIYLL